MLAIHIPLFSWSKSGTVKAELGLVEISGGESPRVSNTTFPRYFSDAEC